jgi:hypothetical protein
VATPALHGARRAQLGRQRGDHGRRFLQLGLAGAWLRHGRGIQALRHLEAQALVVGAGGQEDALGADRDGGVGARFGVAAEARQRQRVQGAQGPGIEVEVDGEDPWQRQAEAAARFGPDGVAGIVGHLGVELAGQPEGLHGGLGLALVGGRRQRRLRARQQRGAGGGGDGLALLQDQHQARDVGAQGGQRMVVWRRGTGLGVAARLRVQALRGLVLAALGLDLGHAVGQAPHVAGLESGERDLAVGGQRLFPCPDGVGQAAQVKVGRRLHRIGQRQRIDRAAVERIEAQQGEAPFDVAVAPAEGARGLLADHRFDGG